MRPKRQFGKAAKPSLGGSCFVRYSMARASRARSWQALAPTDATLVMSFGAVTATCPPANCMAKERLVNGWLALDLGVAAAPQIDGWWHPEGMDQGWPWPGGGAHVPSSNLAPRGLFPDVCTGFPPLLTGGSQMQPPLDNVCCVTSRLRRRCVDRPSRRKWSPLMTRLSRASTTYSSTALTARAASPDVAQLSKKALVRIPANTSRSYTTCRSVRAESGVPASHQSLRHRPGSTVTSTGCPPRPSTKHQATAEAASW